MAIKILSTPGKEIQIYNLSGDDLPLQPSIMGEFSTIICHSGRSILNCNLRQYAVSKRDFAINMPGQIINYENVSADYSCTAAVLSPEFMGSLGFPYNFEINRLIDTTPVIRLSESEYSASLGYYRMITSIIQNNHRFQLEMIRHLTCAYLYGFAHCVIDGNPNVASTSEDILMGRLFDELKRNYRYSRSVKFYAEKLCVSPGYLATVTKHFTGRTVSEWISQYVILEAKALLNTTELSVQQISYQLNFPNQSFFGKYFKKAIGMSPLNYRNQCKPIR